MLPSTVNVRQFKSSDAAEVQEIEKTSIKELTPLSQLVHYYEFIPECFLVAEIEKRIVGFIVANLYFNKGKREGHVLSLAVTPSHRRSGVGRFLLEEVSKILREKRAARIRLEVKSSNQGARLFYLKQGFKESSILHGYYRMRGYSEDGILMTKDLRV